MWPLKPGKPQWERLSELNCFPPYSQGKAIAHSHRLCGSHRGDPGQTEAEAQIPLPMPSHRVLGRGQPKKTRKIKQDTKTQGFQSGVRQAARTCYFFCGEAQKSNVIIANDMLWRPWESSEKAPFQSKQKWEFALFCSFFPLFSPSMFD